MKIRHIVWVKGLQRMNLVPFLMMTLTTNALSQFNNNHIYVGTNVFDLSTQVWNIQPIFCCHYQRQILKDIGLPIQTMEFKVYKFKKKNIISKKLLQ